MRYMITATGTITSPVSDTETVQAGVRALLESHPQTVTVESVTVERVPDPEPISTFNDWTAEEQRIATMAVRLSRGQSPNE